MVRQQQNRHGDVVEYRFLTPADYRVALTYWWSVWH